jgi:hypothetical protein
MVMPVGQAVLVQAAPQEKFGRVMAAMGVPAMVGPVLGPAFCVNALRIPHALIDLRLFAKRGFASASASMFASGFVLFGAMGALPLYYQDWPQRSAPPSGGLRLRRRDADPGAVPPGASTATR